MKKLIRCAYCVALCTGFLYLQGCQSLPLFDQTFAQAKSAQTPHTARVLLVRPREALLALGDENPYLLYLGAEKIGKLPHGRFVTLEKQSLDEKISIHWFSERQPKVSQILQLELDVEQGKTEVIELRLENETLVAHPVTTEAPLSSMTLVSEQQLEQQLSNTMAQTSERDPETR